MASILAGTIPWHEGEERIHHLLHVPHADNPTVPYLSPGAGFFLQNAPLLALGTLDQQGRPWSTLWGGTAGFAEPIAESLIGLRAQVDRQYDPVARSLLLHNHTDNQASGHTPNTTGKMVSGLAIDLENRRRVKLFGRMVAGYVSDETAGPDSSAHLVIKIEESLGNCPKYLNKKHIVAARPEPRLISDSPQLPPAAVELLSRADTIFVSSSQGTANMDTNIRGGPPGFVRLASNDASGTVILYPEYSGNRLYQTLGNLQTTPWAGYVVPDFETGNVLYATGRTEVLVGKEASSILPRSNVVVRVTLAAAVFVTNGLAFRGQPGDPSPYNPSVRYLATEKGVPAAQGDANPDMTATLIKKEELTLSINRFRFRISSPKPISWLPGQYVTLSFQEELDVGYSHMRDDDPTSLNDDFVRTFTVSSYPGRDLPDNELELTIRRHGNVTSHLFRTSERAGLEVPLKGFGGSFRLSSSSDETILPFVAGGIGITPLIAQLPGIQLNQLRLLWSVSIHDVGLVQDTFQRWAQLPASTTLFITGPDLEQDVPEKAIFDAVQATGVRVERRRMQAADLDLALAETWYLCAGTSLKTNVLNWLAGKTVVYEEFNY